MGLVVAFYGETLALGEIKRPSNFVTETSFFPRWHAKEVQLACEATANKKVRRYQRERP